MKKARLNLNQRPPSNAGSQKIIKKKNTKETNLQIPAQRFQKMGKKSAESMGPPSQQVSTESLPNFIFFRSFFPSFLMLESTSASGDTQTRLILYISST
jgi:hypothetical protein